MPAKKKGAPASTSKPVRRRDGKPTMAEKKAANKVVHAAQVLAANKIKVEVVETTKAAGRSAALPAELRRPELEWTEELNISLFALISTGHGMREISEMEGMPPLFQLLRWLGDDTHPFVSCRARAKALLVPLYEEMAQSIAMNSNLGEIVTEKQVVTKDGDIVDVVERRTLDNVERSKLALQGLQWTLGHLMPKKHGRTPDTMGTKPNEQLEGLFAALKAGPVE